MREMMKTELHAIQGRLLKMLSFFHNFCMEHGLSYYVIGGTMLGAARHKGFIPWDDDIDIGMPRRDFDKLEMYEGKVFDTYVFETQKSTDPNYCFPYSKLYDTSTTLIENTRHILKRGLYIDIFPLSGAGNTMMEAEKHYARINKMKQLLKLRNSPDKEDRAWYKNLIIQCVRLLPDTVANEKLLCHKIDKECRKYDFNDTELVANLVGAWGTNEIMPREYFGKPTIYQFEDMEVFGVEKYDEFLTHIYGNWRSLPPMDKQVSHHDHVLDLNTSYLKNSQGEKGVVI